MRQMGRQGVGCPQYIKCIQPEALGFVFDADARDTQPAWGGISRSSERLPQVSDMQEPYGSQDAASMACVGAFIFDGVFIGTTHISEMRNAMAASAAVWGLVLYFCLPVWDYHAIWMAMIAFMVSRSILLWGYYGRVEAAAADNAAPAQAD